jgi:aryl-alcohol dehydrogenase-like predicted oxidoreductase
MPDSPISKLDFSRLMLGTVQFGLNYGIANRAGQPTFDDVKAILRCVHEQGINCIDTAAGYGTSEEVLGRALAELDLAGQFIIVTKVKHLPDGLSVRKSEQHVEESVLNSLKRLRVEVLPVCLFHVEKNVGYVNALQKLKERGIVRHIGVSISTPPGAERALDTGLVDALQIPTNVLDDRYASVWTAAKQKGVALFARSIYLQGLLLMTDADTPPALAEVIPIRRQLASLATQSGISMTELAMRYVLSIPELTSVLIGVDSVSQARENIALGARGPLSADLLAAIRQTVPALPEAVLNPILWNKPPAAPR